MKFRNPARHYPSYLCHVYFKDGRYLNIRGGSSPEISLPVEEDEVLAVVVKILDASREVKMTRLLVDGEWSDYSEEALEAILSPPKSEPKPYRESKVHDEFVVRSGPKSKLKVNKLPTKADDPATRLEMKVEVAVDKDIDKE